MSEHMNVDNCPACAADEAEEGKHMPKLKTQVNTPEMQKRVLAALRVSLEGTGLRKHRVYFDHDQWWALGDDIDGDEHAYSVVDATGGLSVDGFDFEEV